jgi:hypothetical protein
MTRDFEDEILKAIKKIGDELGRLGTNNAMTEMGAVEMLAMEVKNGTEAIANSLSMIAEAIAVNK